MKVNTGTLLMVVACLATSSYLLSSWTTESQRSRALAAKLKETTAQLLAKEEMASQCAMSEAVLHTELERLHKKAAEAEAEAAKASTEAASTVTTCKSIGEAAREREHLADAARTAAQRSAAEAVAAAEKHSTEATRLQHQLTAAQAGMERDGEGDADVQPAELAKQAKRTLLVTVKAELAEVKQQAKSAEAAKAEVSWQLKQCASQQTQLKGHVARLEAVVAQHQAEHKADAQADARRQAALPRDDVDVATAAEEADEATEAAADAERATGS